MAAPGDSRTPAAPAQRYFGVACRYGLPPGRYLALISLPWLLPAIAWRMAGPRWLVAVLGVLSGLLSVSAAVGQCPARLTVLLTAQGVRYRGRLIPWSQVTGTRLAGQRRGRSEPERLELLVVGASPIAIPQDLTRTASVQSLRNLAAMIDEVRQAAAADPARAGDGP